MRLARALNVAADSVCEPPEGRPRERLLTCVAFEPRVRKETAEALERLGLRETEVITVDMFARNCD
jgi:hypothetical protein